MSVTLTFDENNLPNLDQLERQYIELVFSIHKTKSATGRVLGLNRRTVYRKFKKWGIPVREVKSKQMNIFDVPGVL